MRNLTLIMLSLSLTALAGCEREPTAPGEGSGAETASADLAGSACPPSFDWLPSLIKLPPDCTVVSLDQPDERNRSLQLTTTADASRLIADYAGELYMEGYVVKQLPGMGFLFSGPDVTQGRVELLDKEYESRPVIQVDVEIKE